MSMCKSALMRPSLSKDDEKLRQGYVDLKKATTVQLEELIERQEKLLRNKAFINKLPDKGEKILAFRDGVQRELNKRQQIYDSTCSLLSNLKISETKSEDLEWNNGKIVKSKGCLDSDDDDDEEYFSASEVDPLKILATHSGTGNGTVRKNLKPSQQPRDKVSYINKMCEKYDSLVQPKERFKPNQLKENKRDLFDKSAEKLKERLGDKWEVTEAIPPTFKIKNVKSISLMESIQLQKEQADKLRETEKKLAAEKLLLNMNIKMGEKLPSVSIEGYRERSNDFDEIENESDEEQNTSDEN